MSKRNRPQTGSKYIPQPSRKMPPKDYIQHCKKVVGAVILGCYEPKTQPFKDFKDLPKVLERGEYEKVATFQERVEKQLAKYPNGASIRWKYENSSVQHVKYLVNNGG